MATLEKLIDEAAESGGLTAVTLWRRTDGRWSCNVRRRISPDSEGWRCIPHDGNNLSAGLIEALIGPVSDAVVHDTTKPAPAAPDEDIFG